MNGWQIASAGLVICLAVIAARVAIILAAKKTAWKWIVLYWIVLTAKNLCDYFGILVK